MTEKKQGILALPSVIPVFPLPSVILLPGSSLPLNIFEPRYLTMVRDAINGQGLIGMIQASEPEPHKIHPTLYGTGCVGVIGSVKETGDGRFLIRLKGISRFLVSEELAVTTPYRQVQADWSAFEADTQRHSDAPCGVNRESLLHALHQYLDLRGLDADYDAIAAAPDTVLVNTLSMIVPFGPQEKQALLEAVDVAARSEILRGLLVMAVTGNQHSHNPGAKH